MIHIRKCLHCEQDFVLKNIAYEKRGQGKYCSKNCSKYATKKYSFNENFFDVIDTSEKSYWLGFCMADGCNTGDELTIEISAKDKDHLIMMKNSLDANHPIHYRNRKKSKMASLRIANRYLCKQLDKWGCTQNKSFTLQYPSELPIHLTKDFIRGFFDGDGCIYIRNDEINRIFSIYSVSLSFLMTMKNIIERDSKVELHHYTQDNGHIISAMKKDYIDKLYHYLYDGALIYLERKREKFMSTPLS